MDWKSIGEAIAKLGLPALGTALLGPAGGLVGNMLANAIGSDKKDPQAILEALTANADALQKAKEFEANHSKDILQIHMNALVASDHAQSEVNLEEAKSDSLFKSGWRPAAGWVCVSALGYQFLARPVFSWLAENMLAWKAMPSLETDTLMTLLFGLLGLGAYRMVEKLRDKA